MAFRWRNIPPKRFFMWYYVSMDFMPKMALGLTLSLFSYSARRRMPYPPPKNFFLIGNQIREGAAEKQRLKLLAKASLIAVPFCMRIFKVVHYVRTSNFGGLLPDTVYNEDCLEGMKRLPDGSVSLAIIDPPYNIGVNTQVNGKNIKNDWDKIDDYQNWMIAMLKETARVLKDTGVLYLWHNDMAQIAELIHNIHKETPFMLRSFCIWDKGDAYRVNAWRNRRADSSTALRSWFNICEYCLHFFKGKDAATGLDLINSNPECYKSLKDWYYSEMRRLGLAKADVHRKYCEATGKSGYMLRHYFCDSQFELPIKEVWEKVYKPLGFSREYEDLRHEYEDLRHTHNMDTRHSNIWHLKPVKSNNRYHTCQKPTGLIERLIRVSSNPGELVLDNCMGSGTTAVAAINTGRHFIGFEKEKKYFDIAQKRIALAQAQTRLDFEE